MTKLKKKLGILGACLIFGLAAMGSSSSSTEVDKDIKSSSTGDTQNTQAEQSSDDSQMAEEAAKETTSDVTVAETVLLDEKDIKITATGLEDGLFGTELKLLIENNSSANVTIQARKTCVNGFMVDSMLSADVAAGKKANDNLTFTTSGLKDCGIDTIATMEFSFHIFTTEDWEDYLDSDLLSLNTSVADTYTQTYDDSGEVFYDQNGIKIIGKGLSTEGSFWGPGLILYIENSSDKDFTVQVRAVSVNGFMIEPILSQDVLVGKKALTAVTFFDTDLEENGITDISEIEASFHVFDMDSWDTIVDTEPVKINF